MQCLFLASSMVEYSKKHKADQPCFICSYYAYFEIAVCLAVTCVPCLVYHNMLLLCSLDSTSPKLC